MNWRSTDFPATEAGAQQGIVGLVRQLADEGLDDDLLGKIEIVLAEVVNNIVEHAYREREDGDVNVRYCLADGALRFRVVDAGEGFPQGRLPAGDLPDLAVATTDLPEGGFGWNLIRTLTSDVSYCRRAGYNDLALRFDL
jgi:serine/threonine-protein kinase RsbW